MKDNSDWIEWDGSKGSLCPVNADLWVEYKTRSGYIGSRVAGWLAWRWGSTEMPIDIVAYRVEGKNGTDA